MSGLLRRLTRRRPATADETGPAEPASSEPAGAPAETPVEPGGDQPVPAPEAATATPAPDDQATATPAPDDQATATPAPDEQATQVIPATGEQTAAIPAVRDLPAGVDPTEYADAPEASAPRGKVRRRLRFLRRTRDLLLRDLGGFTFEIRRTAGGTADETQQRLLESKMKRIEALDTEVRALEGRLGVPHADTVLHEPGIGGTCPECGELYASDAHYCSRCGTPLDAKARARHDAAVAAAVQQTTGSHQVAEPAPASLLWAAGPRPDAKPEDKAPADEPQSDLTSQWLTLPPRSEEGEAAETETAAEPAPKRRRMRKPKAPAEPGAVPAAEAAVERGDEPAAEAPAEPGDEPAAETAVERGDEHAGEAPTAEVPVAEASAAEASPAEESTDAEASPAVDPTDAEAPPAAESTDPEAPTTEVPAAEAPPAAESTDAEASPAAESTDAEAPPAAESTDAEASPAEKSPAEPAGQDEPTYTAEPNGRGGGDVPDPLTSRRDQAS